MTGSPMKDISDGIFNDREWVSWNWIDQQIYGQDPNIEFPKANISVAMAFKDLLEAALSYKEVSGRYLQIWGEIGELFAEIRYGIKRHWPGTEGSDGRIGNDWVEIKTMSPEKENNMIRVKRAGNFNKLLIVKINENFQFQSRLVDRKRLKKGSGKYASLSWSSIK
jgi:hypothetical protein